MEIFNINHTLFTLWSYDICLLEFVGVVLGVCSVWLATQGKAVNFLVGIVGMSCLGFFFYQKGLYSSLILQIILVGFCAWGYYNWTKPKKDQQSAQGVKKTTLLTPLQRLFLVATILVLVGVWGSVKVFVKPDFLNAIFPKNYEQPILGYADAFVLFGAMTGMFLRTQKKYESWFVFMAADFIGVILYTLTGAYFVTMMCSIYLLLDAKGVIAWRKEMKKLKVES